MSGQSLAWLNKMSDKPKIIIYSVAVTETFLSDDVNDSELANCSKYRVLQRHRDHHGGGIMMIVSTSSNLPAVTFQQFGGRILRQSVKSSPNTTANLSQLRRTLSALPSMLHILLCGDFNVPSINWDTTSAIGSNSLVSDLCDIPLPVKVYNFKKAELQPLQRYTEHGTLELLLPLRIH